MCDDNIPCANEKVCKFTTARRMWCDADSWTTDDSDTTWTKTNKHCLWKISQSTRLTTIRQGIFAFFHITMNDIEYNQLVSTLDALASPTNQTDPSVVKQTMLDEESALSRLIPQLGHAPYLSVITERCAWPDGNNALRSLETLIVSDGSYNCMGSGAWGLWCVLPTV